MYGTKSLFRNEKLNNFRIEVTPNWRIPRHGILEFDFSFISPLDKTESSPVILNTLSTILNRAKASSKTLIKIFRVASP